MSKDASSENSFGIIMRSTGNLHQVRCLDNGEIVECRIKGKLRMQDMRTTNPVAVGDRVQYEIDYNKTDSTDKGTKGVIVTIEKRHNCIARKSVNLSKHSHIIAANIDRAYLIVTLAKPQTSTVFIDRFLVTAEAYRIPVTIIFNKIDIYEQQSLEQLNDLKNIYSDIGYECLTMSAFNQSDIDLLKEKLVDNVNLFSGHSGVGKSTLINALEPNLQLKTGEISEQYGEGKHTTTFAEMFELSNTPISNNSLSNSPAKENTGTDSNPGYIIDTPGIRGFGIIDIDREIMANYFPEIFAIHQHCKFSNCQHLQEPKCAIHAALDAGLMAESRYDSYLSIYYADDTDQYRRNTRSH